MTRLLSFTSLLLLGGCAGSAMPVSQPPAPTSAPAEARDLPTPTPAAAPPVAAAEATARDGRSPIEVEARIASLSGGTVRVEVDVTRLSPLQLPLRASVAWPEGVKPIGNAALDLPPVQTVPSHEQLVFEAAGRLPSGRVTVTVAGRTAAAGYRWQNEVDANGRVVPPPAQPLATGPEVMANGTSAGPAVPLPPETAK